MRAVLVTMAGAPYTPSFFMPDNGLAGLAGTLLARGHEVQVIDLNCLETMDRLFPLELRAAVRPYVDRRLAGQALGPSELVALTELEAHLDAHRRAEFDRMGREVAATVSRWGARFVGLKLWNGDGFSGSLRIARAVRAELGADVTIVAGGPHADFFGEAIFEHEDAAALDALAIAEGEPTIAALGAHVDGGLPLDEVPNLILPGSPPVRTRLERVESLDALPPAVYDAPFYPRPGRFLVATYEETRGCRHRCAFCNHPLKAGSTMRERAVAGAVDDLVSLSQRHGFRGFKLGGSYTPSAYARALATEIRARGLRLALCSYGRVSDAEEADFPLFAAAGYEALFFGIETGSQALLNRAIHKGHRVLDSARVLQAARSAGIFTIASIVYPNPGETPESRAATLALLREARPDGAPVHFPLLLPGSGWFREPERYGFEIEDRARYLREGAAYKPRLLFPNSFWAPLGYRVDGKPFRVFAAEADALAREVEALGIITLVSDEAALLARLAGEDVRTFRDRMRLAFATGDVDALAAVVEAVNRPTEARVAERAVVQ